MWLVICEWRCATRGRKHRFVSWDLPEVDITQPDTYEERLGELQPTWVVHLAAIAAVGTGIVDPEIVQRVNVEGTRQLLAAITSASPETHVLVASSADIYGAAITGGTPLPELPLAAARPRNPYGESKRAMEELIEAEYAARVLRVRPFPHIGPGQQKGFVAADFAAQIAAIEAGAQEPVLRVGNLEARRDFTDVRDVVRAYRLLLEQGEFGTACGDTQAETCGVYHVASGVGISIQALLDQLLALSTAEITVETDSALLRPSDTPVVIGDATKLRALTGWQPEISLAQSLGDVLADWRARV